MLIFLVIFVLLALGSLEIYLRIRHKKYLELRDLLRSVDTTLDKKSICVQLQSLGITLKELRLYKNVSKRVNQNWTKYSGDSVFPIPHPNKTPRIAWQQAATYFLRDSFWEGEYGANRREYLTLLIKQCEKM